MVQLQKILGMFCRKFILHLIVLHIENGLTTEQLNFNQLYRFGRIVVQSTNNSQLIRTILDSCVLTKSQWNCSMCACLCNDLLITPRGILTTSIIHGLTQRSSLLQFIMTSFSYLWWFCREVFDADKITNSADNLKVGYTDKHHVTSALLIPTRIDEAFTHDKRKTTHIKGFHQVLPSVWSRNADTSSCKKKRCRRECHSNNSNLKYTYLISSMTNKKNNWWCKQWWIRITCRLQISNTLLKENDILKENYIRSIVLFGSLEYNNELYY